MGLSFESSMLKDFITSEFSGIMFHSSKFGDKMKYIA